MRALWIVVLLAAVWGANAAAPQFPSQYNMTVTVVYGDTEEWTVWWDNGNSRLDVQPYNNYITARKSYLYFKSNNTLYITMTDHDHTVTPAICQYATGDLSRYPYWSENPEMIDFVTNYVFDDKTMQGWTASEWGDLDLFLWQEGGVLPTVYYATWGLEELSVGSGVGPQALPTGIFNVPPQCHPVPSPHTVEPTPPAATPPTYPSKYTATYQVGALSMFKDETLYVDKVSGDTRTIITFQSAPQVGIDLLSSLATKTQWATFHLWHSMDPPFCFTYPMISHYYHDPVMVSSVGTYKYQSKNMEGWIGHSEYYGNNSVYLWTSTAPVPVLITSPNIIELVASSYASGDSSIPPHTFDPPKNCMTKPDIEAAQSDAPATPSFATQFRWESSVLITSTGIDKRTIYYDDTTGNSRTDYEANTGSITLTTLYLKQEDALYISITDKTPFFLVTPGICEQLVASEGYHRYFRLPTMTTFVANFTYNGDKVNAWTSSGHDRWRIYLWTDAYSTPQWFPKSDFSFGRDQYATTYYATGASSLPAGIFTPPTGCVKRTASSLLPKLFPEEESPSPFSFSLPTFE